MFIVGIIIFNERSDCVIVCVYVCAHVCGGVGKKLGEEGRAGVGRGVQWLAFFSLEKC